MKKVIVFITFLLSSYSVFGQTLTSGLGRSEIYTGEDVIYIIETKNFTLDPVPELDFGDAFQTEYIGAATSSSTVTVNGRTTHSVSYRYQWRLTTQNAGVYTIPALTIAAGGKEFRTMPARLTVKEPEEVEGIDFRLTAGSLSVYPQQPVLLGTSLSLGAKPLTLEFRRSGDFDGKADFLSVIPKDPDYELKLNGRTVVVDEEFRTDHMEYRFYETLVPLLENQDLDISYQAVLSLPRRRSGYIVTPTNNITIQVKSLPEEVRQLSSGLLLSNGDFEAELFLAASRVYQGDSVEMTLVFRNLVNYQYYRIPEGFLESLFGADFEITDIRQDGDIHNEEIVWKATVRPLRSGENIQSEKTLTLLNVQTDRVERFQLKMPSLEILDRESGLVFQGLNTEESGLSPIEEEPQIFFTDLKKMQRSYENPEWVRIALLLVLLSPVLLIAERTLRYAFNRYGSVASKGQLRKRWLKLRGVSDEIHLTPEQINFIKEWLELYGSETPAVSDQVKNLLNQSLYGSRNLTETQWKNLFSLIDQLVQEERT